MIRVFSVSLPGNHAENEDAFAVRRHPRHPGCLFAVLADGQGGRAGGARAAQLACSTAIDRLSAQPIEGLMALGAWQSILGSVDQTIAQDSTSGFTTLITLCIARGTVYGASAGDSAVAAFNADHSHLVLTDNQHKNPSVGSGAAKFVTFGCQLRCPWTVLAMSDGVWKYVGWEEVVRVATTNDGEAIIDLLLDRARLPGRGVLPDDFTAVVLQSGPD
jgi:serine/threonine protein phosphatase PrpC